MKTIFQNFYGVGQSLMYQGFRSIRAVKINKILVKKTFFSSSNIYIVGRNFYGFTV